MWNKLIITEDNKIKTEKVIKRQHNYVMSRVIASIIVNKNKRLDQAWKYDRPE